MPIRRVRLLSLMLVLLVTATGAGREIRTPQALERQIFHAFERGQYRQATELIDSYLQLRPNSADMLYNLACAYSRLDELERATSSLFRAVEAGFRDFEQMRSDPDLRAIRNTEMFRAILEAAKHAIGERADVALERWKRTYGSESYRFEIDDDRRLAYATALDSTSHRQMRQMIEREADHLIEKFFGAPPEYYVLIAIPTPEDAHMIFHGDASVGGRYEHDLRRLVARNIGGSLRHEFFHVLHYGHMERLGLKEAHPLWIQEGMAALYEDYVLEEDGSVTIKPNGRHNSVKRWQRRRGLLSWERLFTLPAERFMDKALVTYPQSRSIFEYLAEKGKLQEWYRTYVANGRDDRSGRVAMETVFGKKLTAIEASWHTWVRNRPFVDNEIRDGDAALGVVAGPNARNDGVLVARVLPGSTARLYDIHVGDVIVAVEGTPTRTTSELQAVIGRMKVGDMVKVELRRKGRYLTKIVALQPLRG